MQLLLFKKFVPLVFTAVLTCSVAFTASGQVLWNACESDEDGYLLDSESPRKVFEVSMSRDGRYIALGVETGAFPNTKNDLYLIDRGNKNSVTKVVENDPGGYLNGIMISGNGKYIFFATTKSLTSDSLPPGPLRDEDGGKEDAYIYDVEKKTFKLVSTGTIFDNAMAVHAYGISNDGRYAVFDDSSSIYRYDSNEVGWKIVTTTPNEGVSTGSCYTSRYPISDDGRYVVFLSDAIDLIGAAPKPDGKQIQIFIRDMEESETRWITVTPEDTSFSGDLSRPFISPDGSMVSFRATPGLLTSVTDGDFDIYIYTRITQAVNYFAPCKGYEEIELAFSSDGKYMTFGSTANLLVPEDTNDRLDLFVRNFDTNETKIININNDGVIAEEAPEWVNDMSISDDGRYVAFNYHYKLGIDVTDDDKRKSNIDAFIADFKGIFTDGRYLGTGADNPNTIFSGNNQTPTKIGLPDYTVNTATLNLALRGTLFWMKTRSSSIAATLTYNATPDRRSRIFGNSWKFAYETYLNRHFNGTVPLHKGSGQELIYSYPNDFDATDISDYPCELIPPEGIFDKLTIRYEGLITNPTYYFTWWQKSTRRTFRYDYSTDALKPLCYLTSITDRNGNKVSINVDLNTGMINNVSGPTGRKISFSYDTDTKLCTKIHTPSSDARTISFSYDENGNLAKIIDMAGYVGTYEYDADNYMTKMTQDSHWATFKYASRGVGAGNYITEVKDKNTYITTYELTSSNPVTIKRTNRRGKIKIFKSKSGLTSEIIDPLGGMTKIDYKNKLPVKITDQKGNIKWAQYDTRGNVTLRADAENHWHRYFYNPNDTISSYTTPIGNTWNFSYDIKQNLTKVTSPLGKITQYVYDTYGQLENIVDANGNITQSKMDSYGNLTQTTDALGNITVLNYTSSHLNCTDIADAKGNIKGLKLDKNDRLTQITYGVGTGVPTIINKFNAFGQTTLTDENGNTISVNRNYFGHITKKTPPLGNITYYTYDTDNNLARISDPAGKKTYFTYDSKNQLTRTSDKMGGKVYRSYDKDGNLISLTDQNSNKTRFNYDANDRLTKITDPLGEEKIITYDSDGNISETQNAKLQKVSYTYDEDSRKTKKLYDGTIEAEYTYDNVGNLISLTDDAGITAYTYDATNQLLSITYPDTKSISFTYDKRGNIASITYPDGLVVNYEYDNYNRIAVPRGLRNGANVEIRSNIEPPNKVTKVSWNGTNSVTCTYDKATRLTECSRSNETTTTYSYDNNNRVTGIDHKTTASSFLTLGYSYNVTDNVTRETSTHTLTPSSSNTSINATYDTGNQIATWNDKTAVYDADGNITTDPASGFSAEYDNENRPTKITRDGKSVTYVYGGKGPRWSSTDSDGKTLYYHYGPQGRLLCVTNSSGTTKSNFIYRGKVLSAIGTVADGFKYYHFDRMGNTMMLTGATGAVAARYTYMPYGQITREDSNIVYNPFTYVGALGVMDEGNELFFMKNRYYDSTARRFLHRDPIGFEGGINLYAYAGGNPVMYVDPDGTSLIGGAFLVGAVLYGMYNAHQTAMGAMDAADEARKQNDNFATNYKKGGGANIDKLQKSRTQAYVKGLKKTSKIAKTVPGTSMTGDVPTSPTDVVVGVAIETINIKSLKDGDIMVKDGIEYQYVE